MVAYAPAEYRLGNGRTLTLRSVAPDDFEAFVAFLRSIGDETTHTMRYPGVPDPERESTTPGWLAAAASPHDLSLGAFDGALLLGMLRTRKERPDHPMRAHVATFGMMMLKEVWGQGLGAQFLAIQDAHALATGVTRLEAGVRAKNTRAIALYRKAGFKVEGTLEKYAKIGGAYEDELGIAKHFGDAAPAPFALPTLTTARLVLRQLTLADADAIFAYGSDPEVVKYTLWNLHESPRDSRTYLREYAFPRYAARELDPFGITLAGDPGRVIGTVGCFRARGDASGRILELAYALARPHWGQGLAVEAARALIGHGYATIPQVERIQAHCDAENRASARVMEKLGMSYEGTARSDIFVKGAFRDTKSYAILRSDGLKY